MLAPCTIRKPRAQAKASTTLAVSLRINITFAESSTPSHYLRGELKSFRILSTLEVSLATRAALLNLLAFAARTSSRTNRANFQPTALSELCISTLALPRAHSSMRAGHITLHRDWSNLQHEPQIARRQSMHCLLYTSDAADE